MPRNVIFAAPFPTDITMRFVRAAARLPEVRLLGIVHTPPEGEDAAVYRDLVRVTDPTSAAELQRVLTQTMSPQTRAFELSAEGSWHLSRTDPDQPTRHLQNALLRRIVDRTE